MDECTTRARHGEGATSAAARDLVAELLADDVAREALMRLLLDALADREIVCRRLMARDSFGRDRVDIDARSTSAGGLRVFTFSAFDDGYRANMVDIGGNEECEKPFVHLGLVSGGEPVLQLETGPGPYGTAAPAAIRFDEYEPDLSRGSGRRLRTTTIDPGSLAVGEEGEGR